MPPRNPSPPRRLPDDDELSETSQRQESPGRANVMNSAEQASSKEPEMIGRANQVFNKRKQKYEYFKKVPSKARKLKFTQYVVFVRTIISEKGFPVRDDVDIRGCRLQEALLELNKETEGFSFHQDPPKIDQRILFHSRQGLHNLKSLAEMAEPKDERLIFELDAGLRYVLEEYGSTLGALESLISKNEITFEYLWAIFPPNTIAYGKDMLREGRAFLIRSCAEGEDPRTRESFMALQAEYIDYDGKATGKVRVQLKITSFEGARRISALPYVPLALHEDAVAVRTELLGRGRKALKLHRKQLVEYQGHGLREGEKGIVKFHPHGRIMLDPETFDHVQPNNEFVPAIDDIVPLTTITEEQLLTMNSVIYGFCLGDKIWGAFAISRITEVVWNTNMFDSLVLDKEQRDFVHDLVQTHSSKDENSFDDFVTHKGKGLIGLLAGPPGVGKTLTAEAVAEVTKRPLYMISSGELGSIPSAIHDRLVKVMELAELWDAVLLLDEADVFLTERDDTNLTRNAIASIFLRELEYYQGILILTTNRIKVFDPAFQSRIHFCLQYENLTPTGRAAIWRSFITRAKATANLKVDISDDDIMKLALEENVNGRQIKNIMSVSQAVAVRRKQVLDLASIRTAAKLSQNFDVKPLALVSRKSWGL